MQLRRFQAQRYLTIATAFMLSTLQWIEAFSFHPSFSRRPDLLSSKLHTAPVSAVLVGKEDEYYLKLATLFNYPERSALQKNTMCDLENGVVDFGKVLSTSEIDSEEINIYCEKVDLKIWASDESEGGNDSHASIEVIRGDLSTLIGREITDAADYYDGDINEFYPTGQYNDDEYSNYVLHVIKTRDGDEVHVLGSHHHNGYYGGGSIMCFEQNAEYVPSMKSEAARFVIVAGLPASGKTTFVKEQFDSKLFAVIDDSFRSPFFKIRLNTVFEKDLDTVVCDPFLCNIKHIQDTYEFALKYLKSPSQIFIIYFENDKTQCLENRHRAYLEHDIHRFHKNYDETIAYIESLEGPVTMKLNVFRSKGVSNLA